MPVWNVDDLESEPAVLIRGWAVYQVRGVYEDGPSRHFVGTRARGSSGRVSSGIESFDMTTRRGTTRSGRVYQLLGSPGTGMAADYVWDSFCAVNNASEVVDVTGDYLPRA